MITTAQAQPFGGPSGTGAKPWPTSDVVQFLIAVVLAAIIVVWCWKKATK